jgi:hypothetical protein
MTEAKLKKGVRRLLTDLYLLRIELTALSKPEAKDHVGCTRVGVRQYSVADRLEPCP